MLKIIRLSAVALFSVAMLASCNEDVEGGVEAAGDAVVNTSQEVTNAATNAANTTAEAILPSGPTTTMDFAETTYEFGTIDEGEKVAHTYKFTNTGDEPLVLSNARGSCGCTVPKWPREPIAPGESGEILVEFNSQGKKGDQNRIVTITANTEPAQSQIFIKGNVTPKADKSPLVQ